MNQPNLPEEPIYIEVSEPLDVAKYISDVPCNDSVDDESIDLPKSLAVKKPIVRDVPLQSQLEQEVKDWIAQKREGSRSGIAITVVVFFGASLLVEFLLIGLGSFYPQTNIALIKDTLPLLINSLTSIVTIVLVFYFKEK
jgi:hypothetical protein